MINNIINLFQNNKDKEMEKTNEKRANSKIYNNNLKNKSEIIIDKGNIYVLNIGVII